MEHGAGDTVRHRALSVDEQKGPHDMTQTEKTPEQLQALQARIAELKAQYQQLQDNYDDEVLLCSSLLRALVNADYGDCEALVKHADCSVRS
jgi:uncharacterized protein with von Willebrand factor type A (vWA) domain